MQTRQQRKPLATVERNANNERDGKGKGVVKGKRGKRGKRGVESGDKYVEKDEKHFDLDKNLSSEGHWQDKDENLNQILGNDLKDNEIEKQDFDNGKKGVHVGGATRNIYRGGSRVAAGTAAVGKGRALKKTGRGLKTNAKGKVFKDTQSSNENIAAVEQENLVMAAKQDGSFETFETEYSSHLDISNIKDILSLSPIQKLEQDDYFHDVIVSDPIFDGNGNHDGTNDNQGVFTDLIHIPFDNAHDSHGLQLQNSLNLKNQETKCHEKLQSKAAENLNLEFKRKDNCDLPSQESHLSCSSNEEIPDLFGLISNYAKLPPIVLLEKKPEPPKEEYEFESVPETDREIMDEGRAAQVKKKKASTKRATKSATPIPFTRITRATRAGAKTRYIQDEMMENDSDRDWTLDQESDNDIGKDGSVKLESDQHEPDSFDEYDILLAPGQTETDLHKTPNRLQILKKKTLRQRFESERARAKKTRKRK